MSEQDDDSLGSFEDYGESDDDAGNDSMAQNADLDRLRKAGPENPTGVDPRPGKYDLCFDRAKPGARVYVVDVLAESVEEYYEENPDAPALDEYEGNVLSRMTPSDAVLAAIYVKDTLTSVSFTAYPMPESRLTRVPAEEANLVGNGSVEFARPPAPGEEHRLSDAEPRTQAGLPDDGQASASMKAADPEEDL